MLKNTLRAGVLSICALFGSGLCNAGEARFAVDIPAGDLTSALNGLAAQTGVEFVYRASQLKGLTTRGVSGNLSAQEAVTRLLEDTQLEVTVDGTTGAMLISLRGEKPVAENGQFVVPAPGGQAASSNPEEVRGELALSGHVTDAITGGALQGALVRILENGDSTSTDDLGNFRLSGLASGTYTLSIVYVGYAYKLWRVTVPSEVPQQFPLEVSAQIAEVTVFGTRSERAKALSQQRAAENSTFTITTDTLGNFSGTTISEALRRVPGVAFQRDERTGDGTNIILRGLAPDMNAIQLNGLNLPVSNGLSRSASLNNLLADSVDRITVHHSLLPSMNSAGSGGLVEIQTKSPLQRGRRYVNFGVEVGRTADSDFSRDLLGTGTVSGTFGEQDAFGLSASVQYRKRKLQTISYNTNLVFGQVMPRESDGSLNIFSLEEVDPRRLFPFEPGMDQVFPSGIGNSFVDSNIETLAGTLSSEWRIGEQTGLRFDVQRSQAQTDNFSRTSRLDMSLFYTELEVAALGGERRNALAWSGQAAMGGFYDFNKTRDVTDTFSLRGNTSHGPWDHHITLGLAKGTSDAPQDFSLSTSYRTLQNVQIDPSFIRDAARDRVEHRVLSPFGPRSGRRLQLPLLTQAGFDFFNDPANHELSSAGIRNTHGENERYSGNWDTRYSFSGAHLKYIEVGANYESRRFKNHYLTDDVSMGVEVCRQYIGSFCVDSVFTPVKVSEMGLGFDPIDLSILGVPSGSGFEVISTTAADRFLHGLRELAKTNPLVKLTRDQQNPLLQRASTKEADFATYVQARVDLGRLEIIGGARLDGVQIDAFNLRSPSVILPDGTEDLAFRARFTRLVNESGVTRDLLPRVQLNFRKSEQLVFRGSYYMAVARPAVRDLSRESDVFLSLQPLNGPSSNQEALSIFKGNPGLKPAVTHSLDTGVEYYSNQIGLMRFNAFYKLIDNLLEANIEQGVHVDLREYDLPDDPHFNDLLADPQRLASLFITVQQPVNNLKSAHIWGVEGHLERQFGFLPGFWSGFGVFGNLTYAESSKRYTYFWGASPVLDADGNFVGRQGENIVLPSIAFDQSPKYSGTLALTYNKYDIDATLTYSDQARRSNGFNPNGLAPYQEQSNSLDLHIARRLLVGGGEYNVYLEATDLLKGTQDPDLLNGIGGERGGPVYFNSGVYLGGRQFRLGFRVSL